MRSYNFGAWYKIGVHNLLNVTVFSLSQSYFLSRIKIFLDMSQQLIGTGHSGVYSNVSEKDSWLST